jgi:hypothetical protein
MKKLRVKREWGGVIVAAVKDEKSIYAEAPIDSFIDRLTTVAIETAINSLPAQRMSELSWSFKQETIAGIVKDILAETLKYSIRTATNVYEKAILDYRNGSDSGRGSRRGGMDAVFRAGNDERGYHGPPGVLLRDNCFGFLGNFRIDQRL